MSKDIEALRIKQIASMLINGDITQRQMAKELNVDEKTVRNCMQKEEFKVLLQELGDRAVEIARGEMRSVARKLAPKAQKALESLLDDDSARAKGEGLRYYFQLIGANNHEETGGSGAITINLPGTVTETIVPTTGKGIPDDSV